MQKIMVIEDDTMIRKELSLLLESEGYRNTDFTDMIKQIRNELRILARLMAHAGEVVSRADLIDMLWENQIYIDNNTLSVNVTRLRMKLKSLGIPDCIHTRRGMSYQWEMGDQT